MRVCLNQEREYLEMTAPFRAKAFRQFSAGVALAVLMTLGAPTHAATPADTLVEGFAIDAAGEGFVVTDNDGVDDSSGETLFWSIGKIE